MCANKLLEVNNLCTSFFTFAGEVQAVRNISFSLTHGEVVGIVGESGSGKSVACLSVIRLLQDPGKIVGGEILFDGKDVLGMSKIELRKLRNNQIGMVFQEPMTSLIRPFALARRSWSVSGLSIKESVKSKQERKL